VVENFQSNMRTLEGIQEVLKIQKKIVRVHELLARDHGMTLNLMEDHLHIRQDTICVIMKIWEGGMCAKFVLYILRDKLKEHSVTVCVKIPSRTIRPIHTVICIIAGNKSWVFQYKPEATCRMEWGTESSQMARNFHLQKSRTKTMLVIFYDDRVVIHEEFVSEGKSLKAQVLERLLKQS
jgi:hypothetical protein